MSDHNTVLMRSAESFTNSIPDCCSVVYIRNKDHNGKTLLAHALSNYNNNNYYY